MSELMKFTNNDRLFMDLAIKAFDEKDVVAAAKVRAAIQAFHNAPVTKFKASIQGFRQKIQALPTVSTDFAKLVSDAFNITLGTQNFDLGYEEVFQDVPLNGTEDSWDMYDVQEGLTFQRVPEGDRIDLQGLTGTLVTVHTDYYGGALGWSDKWIRHRKIAPMIEKAMIFRNNFWANKADNHYLLLAAAAVGNVTAYQGVAGDGQLRRDIATINLAAFTLADRCKDKGYGDTAQVTLILYANPRDKDRVLAAINATTGQMANVAGRAVQINWNIRPIFTFNSNIVTGTPLLVLPGHKIQKADAFPPTTYIVPKDPLTLNEGQAVWAEYGAAVGDTDQVETVTLG